ncbi:MAG TPA: hypothetical protein PLS94_14225, partial [Prolixibacteraceae bacterium]|nr:hypothetical protein [Prolixibacteraceae bacterium]
MEFARNISSRIFYMDEGIIYEQGTPEQIFENPKGEKTKAFIHRIRSMRFKITSPNYDLYALQAEMEAFCEKHMVSQKVSARVILLAEELLCLQPDFSNIELILSYSEKNMSLTMECLSKGKAFNIFEDEKTADELGVILIKGQSKSYNYEYTNGTNNISLIIRE